MSAGSGLLVPVSPNHAATSPEELLRLAWVALEHVPDPEIPVVSIRELGILRDVRLMPAESGASQVEVTITPTYSGCPAVEAIADDVRAALHQIGIRGVVRYQLEPAWTTDWLSDAAKAKLKAWGIAPPGPAAPYQPIRFTPKIVANKHQGHWTNGQNESQKGVLALQTALQEPLHAVGCPRCDSTATTRLSEFGSTACKALYRCNSCQETFDHFKPY